MNKKIILLIILVFSNFFIIKCNEKTTKQAIFKKGPYLIYPNNNTSMQILWQSNITASISEIEWGSTPDYGNGPISVPVYGDNQYKFTITNLTPGNKYYYRINLDGNYQCGSFKTAPYDNSSSVTLYAYGDTRTQMDRHNEVLGALLSDINQQPENRQTIIIHTGDWVSNGDEENDWDEEFFNRNYSNTLQIQSLLPIMGARGNHEGSGILYRKYFPYNYQYSDGYYYSFDYGPAHITIIDDNAQRDPGSNQYNWILKDISNSPKIWKIIIFHQPAWGAGTHGNNEENQILTSNIFEQNKIVLVITGHDHIYAHCYKNPIHHITTGGGGAPLYDINPKAPYYVTATKKHHFLRIDINNNLMCLTSIGISGEIYDNFCIENHAPGSTNNTLKLNKINNNIKLTWQSPNNLCSPTQFAIYKGSLPFLSYNHEQLNCSVSELEYIDTASSQSSYYLVVPTNNAFEGSYGKNSSGNEIPQASNPCHPQNINTC